MTEQSNNNNSNNAGGGNSNPNQSGGPNPNRRPNNRRRHNNRPRDGAQAQGQGPNPNQGQPRQQNPNQGQQGQQRQQGQGQGQGQQQGPRQQNPNQQNNPNQKRRPQHNRPRPQGQGGGQGPTNTNSAGFSVERIYEKYLNLLDQHIIARRKYHDLFYRADPAQKNKLERNFYNTLNDIREFESKLAPEMKTSFEKRNNGYQYDRTYTSNHEIPVEGDAVPEGLPPAEPHYLQSQKAADYKEDTEESVGTADDYLKYKGF